MLQNSACYAQSMLHMLIIMLYKFNILFLLTASLNYKIISISSLSSSSTVQQTINNSSTYVYKHFEFIFLHLQLKSMHILTKSLPPYNSPKSYTPVKNVHFPQILPTVLAIFAYYAGIMLNAFFSYYAQNYAGIIGSS